MLLYYRNCCTITGKVHVIKILGLSYDSCIPLTNGYLASMFECCTCHLVGNIFMDVGNKLFSNIQERFCVNMRYSVTSHEQFLRTSLTCYFRFYISVKCVLLQWDCYNIWETDTTGKVLRNLNSGSGQHIRSRLSVKNS